MDIYHDFIDSMRKATRIALAITGLAAGAIALVAGAEAAFAATLRPETVITGEHLRLGDVFDNVANADYVLGPAPQPGKDMVLNARTLYKIATALDVDWKPTSSTDQIVLRREASIVPQADITAAIEKKFKESGVDKSFSVTYATTIEDIVLPGDAKANVDVTAFNFDPTKDTFNAVVVAPSADNPLKRLNVSGRIERLISVPVLKNTLKSGDIIGALDIDFIELPQHKLPNGTLTEEKDLIGKTPRRVAHSGKPVLSNELQNPEMVERGDIVTLIFANGPMTLTIKGKAMQSGAEGDLVRVSNLESNKNLQGIVTAHREITIR